MIQAIEYGRWSRQQIVVPEAGGISDRTHQMRARWRADQADNGEFLDSFGHDGNIDGSAGIPCGQVVRAEHRTACPVHQPIRVERIDLDIVNHRAEIGRNDRHFRMFTKIEPWSCGNILRIMKNPVRPLPLPDLLPRCAAVCAAIELFIRPPRIQCYNNQRVRVLGINGNAAVAEIIVRAAARYRADIRPDAGCRVQLPDIALSADIRPRFVVIRDVQIAV